MQVCGAKTRNGTPCQKAAMANGRCMLHGGKSLKGAESPTYKTGKFSKYLPERLVKIYEDVESDNQHNILERNIQVREMFLRDSLAKIDNAPESKEVWIQLRQLWDKLQVAFDTENLGVFHVTMQQINRLIDERVLYFAALDDIKDNLAEQRKDKQAIAQIEYRGENAISATELMTLMGAVINVIQAVVTDRGQRAQIADGIDRLFKQPSTIEISE